MPLSIFAASVAIEKTCTLPILTLMRGGYAADHEKVTIEDSGRLVGRLSSRL